MYLFFTFVFVILHLLRQDDDLLDDEEEEDEYWQEMKMQSLTFGICIWWIEVHDM